MVKKVISNPLFIGIIGGLVSNFLPSIIGEHGRAMMQFLYKFLWQGVWPIWVGIAISLIYLFIRFLIRFRVKYINYDIFVKGTKDDLKKRQQDILDVWQKISYFDNQIEQLTKIIIPEIKGNADNAVKNHQYVLIQISELKRMLEVFEKRIQPDGRVLKYPFPDADK